jgi:hypothetical protein
VPQDACEWFGADPSPPPEIILTRIQNHFGAIVQIAIGGMFGLAQVRSVPECGPLQQSGLAFALRAGCRMAVRRSRSALRPAAPVWTKKAQRLWLCFQPVLLSFPLERPIFLREYATVWMRTCERGADDDP